MTQASDIADLVNLMPELDVGTDKKGQKFPVGKLTGPPWEEARGVYDSILAAGADGVVKVIDLIKEADDGADYKARYVLHALAVYVAQPEQRRHRPAVVKALASQLGAGRPKPVQAFLVRQLQVCADAAAAGALGKLLLDEELCEPAAQALLAIGQGAVEQFRQALPKTKGAQRLTIVQALGVLGDGASAAALTKALADADPQVRIAAAWALGNIGEPAAVDALIKAAGADGWERVQAANACLLLAENLLAKGRKADAAKIYRHLNDTRTDPKEQYVREAAAQGLAAAK